MLITLRRRDVILLMLLALLYWATAAVGLHFSSADAALLLWPPAGLALGALLLGGYRLWPAAAAGALLALLGHGIPWASALLVAVGSTLGAVGGAWLLRRTGFDNALAHPRDVWTLLLVGAGAGTLIGVLPGVAGLYLGGLADADALRAAFLQGWMGSVLSVMLLTPLLLGWSPKNGSLVATPGWLRLPEALLLVALTLACSAVVFFDVLSDEVIGEPKVFMLYVFSIWAALRFRLHGAVLMTLLIAALGWSAYQLGLGSFARNTTNGWVQYWLYLMVLSMVSLYIACTYRGRLSAENHQRRTEAHYQQLVESVRAILWESSIDGAFTYVNQEAESVLGYPVRDWLASPTFWLDHIHPEDRLWVPEHCLRESANLGSHRFEYRMIAADGRVVWLEDIVHVKTVKDGKPVELVGVMFDISARKAAETRLKLSQQVFDNAVEGVMITDAEQRILEVNDGVERITGYARAELLGQTPAMLASGQHDDDFFREMWRELALTGQWVGEIWNRRKNGNIYPEWLSISAVRDAQGAVQNYVAVFSDITLRKQSEAELYHLANHDALTGLPNRMALQERIKFSISRARRNEQKLAVLFVDLDRFKVINDALGHHVGDMLLQEVAERLHRCLRDTDTIARQGGDEFVVLVEGFTDTQYLRTVADRILQRLQQPFYLLQQELHVSASIGIAVFPEDGTNLQALLKHADIAMYRAKDQGRNTFQFFTYEANVHSFERLSLESALRRALEREEFEVYYQPKIALDGERIVGAEALLRWNHPDMGLVSPAQFIPLAEETGLIIPIGGWLLKQVCRQNRAWQDAGLPHINVAVNISALQFKDETLAQCITDALEASRLAPAYLGLEITESMLMRQADRATETLQRLRDMGIRVSIDDFGTGYSSLGYLKHFPIDTLKVDQSFVRDITDNEDDAAITRAIIAMAHSLQMEVVAEGVETEAQADFLEAQGCSQVQGFLYSPAVPAGEFAQLLVAGMLPRRQALSRRAAVAD